MHKYTSRRKISIALYNNTIRCYLCDPTAIGLIYAPSMKIRKKKGKKEVQGVPQSQAAALLRHEEEEETEKTKRVQIEQTYEKH